MKMPAAELREIVSIMENLLRFMVVTSYEWSTTPNEKIKHPTITCLPKDADGEPLCHMSRSDWQKKLDLGFGDYVPDTDTTFMSLAMAKKASASIRDDWIGIHSPAITCMKQFPAIW